MRHGSHLDPQKRFERLHAVPDLEHLQGDDEPPRASPDRPVEYFDDAAQSIVSENDSPDVPFRYSVNPYRGCAHGCSYCYARNSHEFLGLNAGLDFETKIFVKRRAPALLRAFLSRFAWRCHPIVFSGVTDCYQPAEREFRLTRQCLEVAAEFAQPVGIVTKNALVLRDLDLLAAMAARGLVHVHLSITTLDPELAGLMEPRTSTPAARLRAAEALAQAGVPVRVLAAPIVPGLNDSEIPALLQAAKAAGASDAAYVLLRLPLTVEPVFREWLARTQPAKAEKVESFIRGTRDGEMYRAAWGERKVGRGALAAQIRDLFQVFHRKHGFADLPPLDCSQFQTPPADDGQLRLF